MKIKKLSIKNYRKFKEKNIEFDSSLNTIIGKNEAGKSTITSALMDVLFTDVKTKSKRKFGKVRSWGQKENPRIELSFEHDGQEYFLKKDFEKQISELENITKKSKLDDSTKIQKELISFLNIPSPEIYESTGFIRQEDISKIRKQKNLSAIIQGAVVEGHPGEDIAGIVGVIEKEIADLQVGMKGLAKKPGLIKYYTDLLKEKREQWLELVGHREKHAKLQKNISNNNEKIAKLQEIQESLERLLKENEQMIEAKEALNELDQKINEIIEDIENVKKTELEINKLQSEMLEMGKMPLDILGENIGRYEEIQREIEKNEEIIQKFSPSIYKKTSSNSSLKVLIILSPIFLLAAIMINLVDRFGIIGLVFIFLAIVSIVFTIVIAIFQNQGISKTRRKIEDLNALVAIDREEQLKILSSYGIENYQKLIAVEAKYKNIKTNIENHKKLIEAVLHGENFENIEKRKIDLIKQRESILINKLSSSSKRIEISPEEYIKKQNEKERCEKELEELKRDIIEDKARMESSKIGSFKILDLEIEIDELEKKLSASLHRLDVLENLKKYLNKALEDTASVASSYLKKDIQKYIFEITNGRYKQIEIDEELNLRVFSNEKDAFVEPEESLSTGTIDQINLLARLSYFKSISKNAPLIFDDPFVSFDKFRIEKVLELLKLETKNRQILFFTHNEFYNKLGNVILLDE